MRKFYLLIAASVMFFNANAQTLVKDINPGMGDGNPVNPVQMGNDIYFIANDGTHGYELWKSDGTTQNTGMVLDINPGSGSGLDYLYQASVDYFPNLVVMNNTLYFAATNGSSGYELWKSDGTANGTGMVKDINPNGDGINFSNFKIVKAGSYLYFTADDGINGLELWKSDGTSNGTMLLKNINATGGSSANFFYADGSTVYFQADDGTDGYEPWVTDGTTGGTMMLKDINPGQEGSDAAGFIRLGNNVFFVALDDTHGQELWVTDGTGNGTHLLDDIYPGAGGFVPGYFAVLGNKLIFVATDATNGSELWGTDGSLAGTTLVKNIGPNSNIGAITTYKDKVYFSADDGTHGNEPWVSDGTTLGTKLLLDINNVSDQASYPYFFTPTTGGLYFQANDGTNGIEPWVTDGTPNGTMMLNQICPSSCSSDPQYFLQSGNTLFFAAGNSNTGRELYKLDLPTGVNDVNTNVEINVFPNPTADELNVSVNDINLNKAELIIHSVTGETVLSQPIARNNVSINTANFASGMYFISINDGRQSVIKKFVKE